MLDNIIQYQAMFFTANARLDPKPETVATLLALFSKEGFLPNAVEELEIGAVTRKRLNLQLITSDKSWHVAFEPNRVIVTRNIVNDSMPTAPQFIAEASSIISRLIDKFDYRGTRLAFILKGVWRDLSIEKMDAFASKLFNLPDFYKHNTLNEWTSRIVTRIECEINGKKETVNAITDVNRAQFFINQGQDTKSFEAIQVGLDINTFQDSLAPRFSSDDLLNFLQFANTTSENIINQIEEYKNAE